jgi:hypothetical protein
MLQKLGNDHAALTWGSVGLRPDLHAIILCSEPSSRTEVGVCPLF